MTDNWTITTPAPLDANADPFWVEMADGIQFATDVYLPPSRAEKALPAVLIRLPYDKSARYTFMPAIAARLTARGFATVVQDVRGKFRSQGQPVPFVNEAADGAATLDWIVGQPWSNGAVGMMGDSYYGFTQWAAVSTGHPALRAIVPRFTGSEFFGSFSPDAVPKIPIYEWIVETFTAAGHLESPCLARGSNGSWWTPADLPHVAETIATLESRVSTSEMDRLAFPHGSPAGRLEVPALHMGGWWDNLQRFQIDDWHSAQNSPAAEHQFLRMSASDHEDYHLHEDGEPHRDHETDDDALASYLDRMMADPLDFFDHYLRGTPGPWPAPRVRYEVANAGWKVAASWDPADAVEHVLYFSALDRGTLSAEGGVLLPEANAESSAADWAHDPDNPVPYLIRSEWGQCANLPDESILHDRPDVVTLTSMPVDDHIEITGPVEVELLVAAKNPRADVIVRLLDVYPTGRARVILEGATTAHTSAGEARVKVRLGDTAYRLRAGHALRVAIAASCYPLYPVRSPAPSAGGIHRPGQPDGATQDGQPSPITSLRLLSTTDAPSLLRVRVAPLASGADWFGPGPRRRR